MTGLAVLTMAHVVISCLALVTGLVVSTRLLRHVALGVWPRNFFILAFATSTSGLFFPIVDLKLSHIIAIASLMVLGPTLRGYYVAHQHGTWRAVYRLGVIFSTYLLAVLFVIQAFEKIPALQMTATAPALNAVFITQGLLFIASLTACLRALRPPAGYARTSESH